MLIRSCFQLPTRLRNVKQLSNCTPSSLCLTDKIREVNRKQFSVSSVANNLNLKNINILSDLKQLPSAPTPALALGLAGLVPFISAPVYMYNAGFFLPEIACAQLAYGASILSFLGGVRWGMLVAGGRADLPPSWSQYSWSVTPSLVAWCALLMPGVSAGCVMSSIGLLAAALVDLQQPGYPSWFRGLRFILTFFAVISLLSCVVFSQTLGSKKQPSDYLT